MSVEFKNIEFEIDVKYRGNIQICKEEDEIYKERVELTEYDKRINNILSAYNSIDDILKKLDKLHLEDNKYCSLYLGDYIERYVKIFLGGKSVPSEMEYRRNGILRRPIDFLMNYNGVELKVKHIASCLMYGSLGHHNGFFWGFEIDYNQSVDAFILSAWDTRKSLTPQYMWLLMKEQDFNGVPFWKREVLIIEDTKKRITFMEKFEMKKIRLGVLQNIVAHAKKKDSISMLVDKRRDIFLKTDIDIDLKKLAYIALNKGLNKR